MDEQTDLFRYLGNLSELSSISDSSFVHPKINSQAKKRVAWNKGLTKETDIRIKKLSEKLNKQVKVKCNFCSKTFNVNIYIEYFGLLCNKPYMEKTKRKLEIYKKLGLRLISIFPSDNIYKKLGFLIYLCSKTQKTIIDYENNKIT